MTRRRVRPEELELWRQVARSTEKLGRRDHFAPVGPAPRKPDVEPAPKQAEPLAPFTLGQKNQSRPEAPALPRTTSQRLNGDAVQMDKKAHTRLKRGKLAPEARIDLHGMTLDQAHPSLIRFILTQQSQGARLVLVITGKGQREDPYAPMPHRRGVLKQQVPMWLRMAPVAQAVLQVTEAHIRHGGGGAYYVYLRRTR
ncbi:Smr/MutS family protein [Puniceibacterium sediminis]|uniref:DNA-nicking endonuclease, Smr domain n=1 Tax=Puniceibacterium sediminis TaxID=1608407 RepID=A0A238VRM8_9RHOB|nr:Smr/MutS family protein [Puniceibacterium sediminis]SNR36992.1 DNA-nicking endonuclease, Smr domain [Puniceibacterium sediminis]